jgi:hypothetical protein
LFKIAGVAVINASQPYYRAGFIYALYVAFNTDLELPHLLPASLFKTLHLGTRKGTI